MPIVPRAALEISDSPGLYDSPSVQDLLDEVFGPMREQRPVYTLRRGAPLRSYALFDKTDHKTKPLAAVFFWPIRTPSRHVSLLLGPMAVRSDIQNSGYGSCLLGHALSMVFRELWPFICVSGSPGYYARFGFLPLPDSWEIPGGSTPPLILMFKTNPDVLPISPERLADWSGTLSSDGFET